MTKGSSEYNHSPCHSDSGFVCDLITTFKRVTVSWYLVPTSQLHVK